jgi:hypothetical protein
VKVRDRPTGAEGAMERSVKVIRCKRTGSFLLNPEGTFRGYGATVGVNPYREVKDDADDDVLGRVVVELLRLSGPTGVAFADAKQFLTDTRDEETVRIRSRYDLDQPGLNTSKMARRFLLADVIQRPGQKSWVLEAYRYDSRLRSMSGAGEKPVRVRHADGPAALGAALRAVLLLAGAR